MRFGQLAASIPLISRKVLTDQLKNLEKNNFLKRKHFKEIPPKVEYSLTKKSENLCSVFKSIEDWSNKNYLSWKNIQTLRFWSERVSSCVLSFIRDVKSASVFSIFLSIQKSDYLIRFLVIGNLIKIN